MQSEFKIEKNVGIKINIVLLDNEVLFGQLKELVSLSRDSNGNHKSKNAVRLHLNAQKRL